MVDVTTAQADVAGFRMTEFRDYREFEHYLKEFESTRAYRWLYEQSLASLSPSVVINGTCGVCLSEACFTAPTRGGEVTPAGRVPNWREGLACNCDKRMINRERALLHYLLASGALQPSMRVIALGEMGALRDALADVTEHVIYRPAPLAHVLTAGAASLNTEQRSHLLVSAEQIDASSSVPGMVSALADLLVEGGRLVFTAAFDPSPPGARVTGHGSIGWSILEILTRHGFFDAKACLFWSEEFGYLGPMNFIFDAAK